MSLEDIENPTLQENIENSPLQEIINLNNFLLFTVLDKNNVVINSNLVLSEQLEDNTVYDLLNYDPEEYKIMQFSEDNSITNNFASIGYTYDEELNAFIPPKPHPSYLLNTTSYEWEPNKELEYDIHGDGTKYKWIEIGWIISQSNEQ